MNASTSTARTSSLIDLFRLLFHLRRKRKFQLLFLLFLMLLSSLSELLSLSLVFPFLAIISSPLTVDHSLPFPFNKLSFYLESTQSTNFLLISSLLFAVTIVISSIIRIINQLLGSKLSAIIGSDLSVETYNKLIHQPYEVQVIRDSNEDITLLTSQIPRTITAINSFISLLSSSLICVSILFVLISTSFIITFVSLILILLLYFTIGSYSKKQLAINSNSISRNYQSSLKTVQESIGALRYVVLQNLEHIYINRYRASDRLQRLKQAENQFLTLSPRYAVESIGVIAIIVGANIMIIRDNIDNLIPVLGTFALGVQKLLPAFQQVYAGWASIKGASVDINTVLSVSRLPSSTKKMRFVTQPFSDSIVLNDVSYSYDNSRKMALSHINIKILKGQRIGIIGKTGSGKSTLMDIIMGLLKPTHGSLIVDGFNVHDSDYAERLEVFQSQISHVPQNIYLSDSSILENIAFGVHPDLISREKVLCAAQKAQLNLLLESRADGLDSLVGERGAKLSGGQCQRIGIARALYKQPDILIFDEATSAIDTSTENSINESIESLSSDLTIIIVAHRLSTVQSCDTIYEISDGKVINYGPPSTMLV